MSSIHEKCETKCDELSIRQIESESNSFEHINENVQTNENTDAKPKNKRKKSTSNDGMAIEHEATDTIHVDYEVVHNENKRQKIEIPPNHRNKDSLKLNGSNVEKSSIATKSKDVKIATETNKLRLKYENIHTNTVQKLNAQADQLRMEISVLRTALANEQNAVRVLR